MLQTLRGRNVPLGFHQLFFEKPLESRIERAFFDLKQIVGRALNMLCEGIAVQCLLLQRSENHHLQRARKEVSLLTVFHGWEALSRFQVRRCCSRPRATSYKEARWKSRDKKKWKHVGWGPSNSSYFARRSLPCQLISPMSNPRSSRQKGSKFSAKKSDLGALELQTVRSAKPCVKCSLLSRGIESTWRVSRSRS